MPTISSDPVVSVEQIAGAALEKIWFNPQFNAFCGRDFMAPDSLRPGSLLFVGINPSYTEADKGIRYYNAHDGQHPYFNPFKQIARETGMPWSHLDMLFQRETEQKSINDLLKKPHGVDFVWQQLQVARQLLDAARPAIIIVCNTKAREFMGHSDRKDWLGLDFQWDEELGTYRHHGIPTFFSSMLSGQRALDSGSHRRLIWHIKRTLKGN